jgi:hypothetical protein
VNLPPGETDLGGEVDTLQRQLEGFLVALLLVSKISEHADRHRLARRRALAPV